MALPIPIAQRFAKSLRESRFCILFDSGILVKRSTARSESRVRRFGSAVNTDRYASLPYLGACSLSIMSQPSSAVCVYADPQSSRYMSTSHRTGQDRGVSASKPKPKPPSREVSPSAPRSVHEQAVSTRQRRDFCLCEERAQSTR